MKKPKITFLMMAYQAQDYISKAIDSMRAQTEPDILLYIRDNGSTDRTGEIIRAYAAQDSRVRFVENTQNGVTDDGKNMTDPAWWPLAPEETGEYISFLDADDWLKPDFAREMYLAARTSGADLTVCGNDFIDEASGRTLGNRIPPDFSGTIKEFGLHFTEIYNCLRTWWGKLYRADFFFGHYRETWAPIPPATWGPLDTVMVLRTLKLCGSVACVAKPLYCFLQRVSASYNRMSPDYWQLLYARALYHEGVSVLQKADAATQKNMVFLLNVHWGFLVEAMQNVTAGRALSNASVMDKLSQLEDLTSDDVLGMYLHPNLQNMLPPFLGYVGKCLGKGADVGPALASYIARLCVILSEYPFQKRNVLLFPMLLACVADARNRGRVGRFFFEGGKSCWNAQSLTAGERVLAGFFDMDYMYAHPQIIALWANEKDAGVLIRQKEQVLRAAFAAADYETVCNLLEEIGAACPFSRDVFYYRTKMAALAGQKLLALLLACTARVFWPLDREIQELFWSFQPADTSAFLSAAN